MIEPTTTPAVVRATAEPARDSSAEQINQQEFHEALERQERSARSRAKAAPEERKGGPTAPADALDPTARASIELATAAPPKATTQAALKEQTTPGANPAATPAQPRASSRPAATGTPANQHPRSAPPAAAATNPALAQPHAAAGAQSGAPSRKTQHTRAHSPRPTGGGTSTRAPAAAVAPTSHAAAPSAAAGRTSSQPLSAASARGPITHNTSRPATLHKPQPADSAAKPGFEPPEAQFARGLAAALRQNGGTVTLRLSPDELGDLTIRLEIRQGSVEARFEAATDQARGLLNDSIDSLRAALEAKGLEVDRLSVHVAERPSEHEAQDAPPRDAGERHGHGGPPFGRHGHGRPHDAARTPQTDPGAELLEIPKAWAEPYAKLGGALRLDAIA